MKKSEAFAEDQRRLHGRARKVSIAGLICAILAMVFQVPEFWLAGIAFQVGAIFHMLASLNARRAAIRAAKLERVARLRELMGNIPT